MRRTILILVAILTALFTQSQNISGQWSGKLDMHGREITVVFDIQKSGSGYTSTMYNAIHGKCGLVSNSILVFDSIVTIRFADAKIELFGSITDAHTFLGAIKQNNELFPVVLSKGKVEVSQQNKAKIRRPESVKHVYSYYNEEVVFENTREKIAMVGRLSMPISKKIVPAVILLCDNNYSNSTKADTKDIQTAKVVDYLTSCGVAVFQFDCREKNDTFYDINNISVNTTTTDVDAIVNYLKTRDEINNEKIKLIDQSNCSLIYQIVAANDGNNLFSEMPDLKRLFNDCRAKSDILYVQKSNVITSDSLYELGKWALQTN